MPSILPQLNPSPIVIIDPIESSDDDDTLPPPAFATNESVEAQVEVSPTISPSSSFITNLNFVSTKEFDKKFPDITKTSPVPAAAKTDIEPETSIKAKSSEEKAIFAYDGKASFLLISDGTTMPDPNDPRNPTKNYQKRKIPSHLLCTKPGQLYEAEGLLMVHYILQYMEKVTSTVFFAHKQQKKNVNILYDILFSNATAVLKQ